jgi:hypothetical protein
MKFLLAITLICCSNTLFAQNLITIKGNVADSTTKTAIDAAMLLQDVTTRKTVKTGSTSLNGNFVLTAIPAGNYTLSVGAMGHKNKMIAINKTDSGTLDWVLFCCLRTLPSSKKWKSFRPNPSLKLPTTRLFTMWRMMLRQKDQMP